MYAMFKRRWYALPALSGSLFILTFHPFNVWPLGFVALVPLFWFAGGFGHRWRTVFLGGFICGGIFAFFLSYYTISQFHWLPETYLFVYGVRMLIVPIVLLGGGFCGASMVAYAALRGRSPLLNAATAGAMFALSEFIFGVIFFGYNVGLLAYAAVAVVPLLSFAALGGAHLLSFVLAFVSGLIAETLIAGRFPRRAWLAAVLISAAVFIPNYLYLHQPLPAHETAAVEVLQIGARERVPYATQQNGQLFWSLGTALSQAASTTPDLLIYPFSPVEGALWRTEAPALNKAVLVASEASVARFAQAVVPASTTLMTWSNVYADGAFSEEYEFWAGGRLTAQYQKRDIFPFIDYTPKWAQGIGLYTTPFDIVPGGAAGNRLSIKGVPLGELMCSELHDTGLARQEARVAPFIIAVGSDAVFVDDVVGDFSLKEAQLRAAENDIPVIRGNILGPSGITDRFGGLVAFAPAGRQSVLASQIPLVAPRRTLYNTAGDLPLLLLLGAIVTGAWRARKRPARQKSAEEVDF